MPHDLPAAPPSALRRAAALLVLAALYSILAALKPMHIDETANGYYARHIANHPLDPFGFEVFWYQHPEPANHVLTPPVLVYWWALAVRLGGPFAESVVLWKLWLFPIAALFVGAFHALARRFARGAEMPLTVMTALSPGVLPSLNLMPDIPALALGLSAVVLFLRGCDAADWVRQLAWSALAGLVAGLAMQTKYTAFVTPAVLLLAGLCFRNLGGAVLAGGLAAGVFAAWEGVTAHLYGESHFLYQVRTSPQPFVEKLGLTLPFLSILGGIAPGVAVLALLGLRRRGWAVAAGVGVLIAFLVVAAMDARYTVEVAPFPLLTPGGQPYKGEFTLAYVVFPIVGVPTCLLLGAAARRLLPESGREGWHRWPKDPELRTSVFLAAWLMLELAGAFALTPFPAVRRLLGVVVVATLAAGRLASRERGALLWTVALANALLGLVCLAVDLCDAHAQKTAVEEAARLIAAQGGGKVWYTGHWGLQFHAERAGMEPVIPDSSRLRAGDWLVLPPPLIDQQTLALDPSWAAPAFVVEVGDALPLNTASGYYGSWAPLEHQAGPRLVIEIRRVKVDHVPRTPSGP